MNIKVFLLGIRPKTLVAAVIPPLCAHSLFRVETGETSYLFLVLCLLLALFIQIATNFYNDAIDSLKGADDNRVGPDRISTQGKVGTKKVLFMGHLFIALAFMVAIPLVIEGGFLIFIIGLISLFLAYGYTGGPYPLAYLGLGELFVFIFFGLVATCGSYFIFSGTISWQSVLLGSQIGFLSCALIAVNNFRDRKTDVLVNKKTLATKMSRDKYLALMDAFMFLPHIFLLVFVLTLKLSYFFPILSVSFAHRARFLLHNYSDESELNVALKYCGIHLLLFGLLFILGGMWG
jgi:1,4-dihydroxy-2-naphthoate polyprenyltransferase